MWNYINGFGLLLYLVNYEIPGILIRVEVGKIAMSVNSVYVLLFKPLLHFLCLMLHHQVEVAAIIDRYGIPVHGIPVRHKSVPLHCNIFAKYCRPSLPRFLLVTLYTFRIPIARPLAATPTLSYVIQIVDSVPK